MTTPIASPSDSPRQFSILDLFGAMTLVAVLAAVLAPLFRSVEPQKQMSLATILVGQLLFVAVVCVGLANRRRNSLQLAGHRLADGFVAGEIRWRGWPMAKAMLVLSLLSLFQLGVACFVVFMSARNDSITLLFCLAQSSLTFAVCVMRFIWRAYPGVVEFFEHGLIRGGVTYHRWSEVRARESQFFSDQFVLVVDDDTHMLWKDDFPDWKRMLQLAATKA